MQYFTKSDNNTDISVHLESLSPSGNYFLGWHAKSRSIIHLYRKLSQTNDAVYGESINYTSRGDDVGIGFSGVVWYEEYGFVIVGVLLKASQCGYISTVNCMRERKKNFTIKEL